MHTPPSSPHSLLRLWLILLGAATLFWSSKEDNQTTTVTLLGLSYATTAIIALAPHRRPFPPKLAILCGAAIGPAASIATTALMLLKNSLHAHLFPDYPPQLMLSTLAKIPPWTLAGALAGLGLSLLIKALATAKPTSDKT